MGAIFSYAVRRRMRTENPVRGVVLFADGKRERRLSEGEYAALGRALRKAKEQRLWPVATDAARFLAVTGWRSGEALGLRWDEIDLVRRTATLGDTKTGKSVRPLSNTACDVLRSINRSGELVFPATRGEGDVIMTGFKKIFKKLRNLGDEDKDRLPDDVTPHTLRHSFSSLAADLNYSDPTIAAMVGHRGRSTTSLYIHFADPVLLAAADAVANRTLELMGEQKASAVVVELRQAAG